MSTLSTILLLAAVAAGPASGGTTPPEAPPPAGPVAVAGAAGVYLWWGLPPAGEAPQAVEVRRQQGSGAFQRVARVVPERDLARARALLASAGDPGSSRLSLVDDFAAQAARNPGLDAGLTLLSAGYARVRGAAWLDADVEKGATYGYRLVRIEADGRETVLGEARATAGRPVAPAAERPAVAADADGVTITIAARPFVAYRVERAAAPGGPWQPADPLGLAVAALPFAAEQRVVDRAAPLDGSALAYRLVPLDLLGWAGPASPATSVTTPDRKAPAPPTALETRGGAGGLELSWTPSGSADVTGQQVWRTEVLQAPGASEARAGERTRLGTQPLPAGARSFRDQTAKGGRTYRYEVTARDAAGNESAPSTAALGAPRDATPPATPAGLTATVGEGGAVTLAWKPVADADLWTYRVLHAVGPKQPLRLLSEVAPAEGGAAPSRVVKLDPRSQEEHRFAVAAVDRSENESLPTPPVAVRLPDHVAPAAPILTGLDASPGAVTVRWSAPAEADLAGFLVFRREPGKPLVRLTEQGLGPATRTFRDAAAPAGVPLAYAVSAFDRAGNLGRPSEARTTRVPAAPPAAPAALTVKAARPGRLALAWTPAPGARGTMVYAAASAEGRPRQVGGLVAGGALEVERGAGPWFRVQSIAGNGTPSGLSAPVEAPPEPAAPARPSPKPAGKGK